jgi:hypothetical protein
VVADAVESKINIKGEIGVQVNVKDNGTECPFHTGKIKSGARVDLRGWVS